MSDTQRDNDENAQEEEVGDGDGTEKEKKTMFRVFFQPIKVKFRYVTKDELRIPDLTSPQSQGYFATYVFPRVVYMYRIKKCKMEEGKDE